MRRNIEQRSPESEAQLATADLEQFALEDDRDRRTIRVAMGIAIAVHSILLVAQFPGLTAAEPLPEPEEQDPYVVQEVRFKPPPPEEPEPPPPQQRPAPTPEVRKVPVPDRTPDEPEPLIEPPPPQLEIVEPVTTVQPVAPQIDLPTPEVVMEIPEPPPPPPPPPEPPVPEGPIQVGGDVKAPVKVNAPNPTYPETARKARIEGTVVVQAVIDKQGRVTEAEVVKDLPMGLGEAALVAVRSWTFEPATLHGKPVSVYYNLTVHFSLQ